jgi:hypothetical protein
MRDLTLLIALAFLLLCKSTGEAQWDDEISPHATNVNWDFTQWCQVGGHRFIFEKTTLGDIAKAFGKGDIVRDGNPGAAVYEFLLRYRWKNQVVIFDSNNDMGGPTHDLEVVEIKPVSEDASSARLPVLAGEIRFQFGTPAMSLAGLEGVLGKARLEGDHAEFQRLGHLPGRDYNGKPILGDITSWLKVKVVHGQLTEIQVSRVTSF